MISKFYNISRTVVSLAGIIIAIVSLITSMINITRLLKNGNNAGNMLYIWALALSITICILLLGWNLKTFYFFSTETFRETRNPVPAKIKDYIEVAQLFEKNRLPNRRSLQGTIKKKDKLFVLLVSLLSVAILICLKIKTMLPEDFFWEQCLNSEYFSFPFMFNGLLIMAALLRVISLVTLRKRLDRRNEERISEMRRSIATETDMDRIELDLIKSMEQLSESEKPAFVSYPDFSVNNPKNGSSNSNRINRILVIETHPEHIPSFSGLITYLYILCGMLLCLTGFILLTTLPADNISVISVPEIAIDYLWTLIKGSILTFGGRSFFSTVSHSLLSFRFRSVIAYIKIEGRYKMVSMGTAVSNTRESNVVASIGSTTRGDYNFNVFTSEIFTESETISLTGDAKVERRLIYVVNSGKANRAKQFLSNTIHSFAVDETKWHNILPVTPI